jgi:hypothetical protein
MKHSINIDVEVADLVEKFDDAFNDAQSEFEMNFTERQYSDFLGENGLTQSAAEAFDAIQNEILRRACVVIRTRWERNGH